ncbi:MAG: septum formation initiator family protein [Halieaceae bacterium]|nr:septum formation initiator family protein [Halieaceae bacterium]
MGRRALLLALLALVALLQYRLWWGEGGRLELRRLQQQADDFRRENVLLRQRNEALAREVLDLKAGTTVLEQRAREELGLTAKDEVFFQFIDDSAAPGKTGAAVRRMAGEDAAGGELDRGPAVAGQPRQ